MGIDQTSIAEEVIVSRIYMVRGKQVMFSQTLLSYTGYKPKFLISKSKETSASFLKDICFS